MQKLRTWVAALQRRRGREKAMVAGAATLCIILTVLSAFLTGGVQAQNGPPPLRAHNGHKLLLPGAVPPVLAKAKRVGKQDTKTKLQLVISLRVTDPNGLATLIANQRNPKSAQYHKYLKPQDFINRFAPPQQNVDAVRKFLTSGGLKVTGVSSNRTLVNATGTVAQAERTFGVTIGQYKLGKRDVYAPDTPPQIPDSLSTVVVNVAGLDNIAQVRPLLSNASQGQLGPRAEQHPAAGPGGGFTPSDLRGAYDVANLISAGGDGTGQRVAVVEFAPYIPGDISAYRSNYSLPSATLHPISIDGATMTCTAGDSSCDNGEGIAEADLDIEVVSALAPNATQDIYVGPNGDPNTYNQIVVDDQDPIATTSWGLCEPYQGSYELNAMDQIFVQAAAQGQSFFAASGDWGSDDCGATPSGFSPSGLPPSVHSPASDPYVLGVGGTSLTLSGGSYSSETTWNNGADTAAGGGGISSYFYQPSYQVGGGVVNSYSTGEREVPDVAADADPHTGYSVYCSSTVECSGTGWLEFGGTSAATPLWASLMTDTNTYLTSHSVTLPGWLSPVIYNLFTSNQTFTPYHDVTSGNNDIDYASTPYAGDYPATACYDMTTGVGSPDAWNIARDILGGVQTGNDGVCKNTAPATTELLQDGGFEQPAATSPWSQFAVTDDLSTYPIIASFGEAHTGNGAFVPCGFPNCDDRVSQSVTIPATVNHAQFRFWVETFSEAPFLYASPPCLDHISATLSTPDGTPVTNGSLQVSCPTFSQVFEFQYENVDVTSLLQAHEGQTLVLTFRGATSSEAPVPFYTSWALDDASLAYS